MVIIRQEGNFKKLTSYLENVKEGFNIGILNKYGEMGVLALQSVTPIDTGKTALSWYYNIEKKDGIVELQFCNSNIQNGVPIALVIEYGHVTGTGGWVEGRDYINPAIQPLFDELAEKAWKEVTKKR